MTCGADGMIRVVYSYVFSFSLFSRVNTTSTVGTNKAISEFQSGEEDIDVHV